MTELPTWAIWAVGSVLGATLTCFLKFSVVLSIVRNALGSPEFLSGTIVASLALVFTLFVMGPVIEQSADIWTASAKPTTWTSASAAGAPLLAFMQRHADPAETERFTKLARDLGQPVLADHPRVVAPAFVATELREAIALAVMLIIPFLLIDLLVGTSLAALGLTNVSAHVVALPIKLLLLLATDGIRLILEAIARSYV